MALLGASSYTYAWATWTQALPDRFGAQTRAFAFLDGTPEALVPDNLRSGVSRACRNELALNSTYAELARHFGVSVLPARVRKPRDKAKAERGVQLVERWVLPRLRQLTFVALKTR